MAAPAKRRRCRYFGGFERRTGGGTGIRLPESAGIWMVWMVWMVGTGGTGSTGVITSTGIITGIITDTGTMPESAGIQPASKHRQPM